MSEKGGGEFFLGFVIGALTGAAAALLMAPTSGEEIRHQIGERSVTFKEQAEKLANEAKAQALHLAEEARSQAEHAQDRGRIVLAENVKKAQHVIEEAQTKLSAAGEAG